MLLIVIIFFFVIYRILWLKDVLFMILVVVFLMFVVLFIIDGGFLVFVLIIFLLDCMVWRIILGLFVIIRSGIFGWFIIFCVVWIDGFLIVIIKLLML